MYTKDELEVFKNKVENSKGKWLIGDGQDLYVHFGPDGQVSTVDKPSLATLFEYPPNFMEGIARKIDAEYALSTEFNKMMNIASGWKELRSHY